MSLILFIAGAVAIYEKGHGTGPSGAIQMIQGMAVGHVGCLISITAGVFSLVRHEFPIVLGLFDIIAPAVLILLIVTGLVRL